MTDGNSSSAEYPGRNRQGGDRPADLPSSMFPAYRGSKEN